MATTLALISYFEVTFDKRERSNTIERMKIDFDLDLSITESPKDGQVNVKLSKSDEIRFKMQKAKYDKQLNEWARKAILKLLDKLEEHDLAS